MSEITVIFILQWETLHVFFYFSFLLDDNVLLENVLHWSAFGTFDEKIRAAYLLTQTAQ